MKTKRRSLLLALAVPLMIAGCDSDLTGINENPNGPTNIGPRYLLPAAIQDAVTGLLGASLTGAPSIDRDVTELWVQHIARLQYGSNDRYDLTSTFSDSYWEELWTEPVIDIQLIVERAEANDQPNMIGIGKVLRAWVFQNMTDIWGSIPYTESLKGHAADRVTTPAYDSQDAIYTDLLAQLADAEAVVTGGGPAVGSSDLIYGGDTGKWKKFANSLRLRVAMRLSEVDPAAAQAAVAAAVAGGVFASAADEAKLMYPGTPPNENPMHIANRNRPGDYRASKTMVDTLTSLADPRLTIYAQPAESSGLYVGMPNGLDDSHGIGFSTVSKIGEWFLEADAPAMIQSYSEVMFLMAEAAQRGWISGSAASYYESGIRASMSRYGIGAAEIDAYLAQPRVAYNPATGLRQIWLQKWIELYDVGPEAYAEWRRTGVPELMPVRDNVTGDLMPMRFPYPTTEASLNRTSLEAAMAAQGGATLFTRVWWDAN